MVNVPVPISPTPNAGIVALLSTKVTCFKSFVIVVRVSVIESVNAAVPLFRTETFISVVALGFTTLGLTV